MKYYVMQDTESVANFGYRKAISSGIKALAKRKETGASLGSIAKQTGRKLGNATRGKVASVGRKLKAVGVKVANKIANPSGLNPFVTVSTSNSKKQAEKAAKAKQQFGVKNPSGTIKKKQTSMARQSVFY